MFYVTAIALIALSHLINKRATGGCELSMRLEKPAVFLAAIASIAAIAELGSFVVSWFAREEEGTLGWLPGLLAYPAGVILFVLVVLVLFPKPVLRSGRSNEASSSTGE